MFILCIYLSTLVPSEMIKLYTNSTNLANGRGALYVWTE